MSKLVSFDDEKVTEGGAEKVVEEKKSVEKTGVAVIDFLKERQQQSLQYAGATTAFFVMLISSIIMIYIHFVLVTGFVIGIQASFSPRRLFYAGVAILMIGLLAKALRWFYLKRINKQ